MTKNNETWTGIHATFRREGVSINIRLRYFPTLYDPPFIGIRGKYIIKYAKNIKPVKVHNKTNKIQKNISQCCWKAWNYTRSPTTTCGAMGGCISSTRISVGIILTHRCANGFSKRSLLLLKYLSRKIIKVSMINTFKRKNGYRASYKYTYKRWVCCKT